MVVKVKAFQGTEDDIRPLVADYYARKVEVEHLQDEMKNIEPQILELFASRVLALGQSDGCKVSFTTVTEEGHVTYVAGSSSASVDMEKLKDMVGSEVWSSITTSTVDKEKFEAAVLLGTIPADVVAQCTTTKERKSYLRFFMRPRKMREVSTSPSTVRRRTAVVARKS